MKSPKPSKDIWFTIADNSGSNVCKAGGVKATVVLKPAEVLKHVCHKCCPLTLGRWSSDSRTTSSCRNALKAASPMAMSRRDMIVVSPLWNPLWGSPGSTWGQWKHWCGCVTWPSQVDHDSVKWHRPNLNLNCGQVIDFQKLAPKEVTFQVVSLP